MLIDGDTIVVPILLIVVSGIFFWNDKGVRYRERVLTCGHGLLLAAVFYISSTIYYFQMSHRSLELVVVIGVVLGLASMVYSFRYFNGARKILLLHVITLPGAIFVYVIGSMAITGSFL